MEKSKIIHPFVKWAGGKTQLLPEIFKLVPKDFKNYYEPFVGGGSVVLALHPNNVTINDLNGELINVYQCFRNSNSFNQLKTLLKEMEKKHSKDYYLEVRSWDQQTNFLAIDPVKRAARFIYLNKSCFNGLYRVNKKGYFNVAWGKKETVNLYDEENFQLLYEYFSQVNVHIINSDYKNVALMANKNDFIYLDPPYAAEEDTTSFTSYTKEGFNNSKQEELRNVVNELTKRGVYVMLSNRNTSYIRQLYSQYNINIVKATRRINSKGSGRGEVEEVLITNY